MKRSPMPARATPLPRGATDLRRVGVDAGGEAGRVTPTRRSTPQQKRRAADERAYSRHRAAFLTAFPTCEVCGGVATDVHHAKGRVGTAYLDVVTWRALCRADHDRVHADRAWAVERGLVDSRLAA